MWEAVIIKSLLKIDKSVYFPKLLLGNELLLSATNMLCLCTE